MAPALQRAMRLPAQDGLLRQIVFVTDGSVGNESELLLQIGELLEFMGEPSAELPLDGSTFEMDPVHALAGNPSRMPGSCARRPPSGAARTRTSAP